MSLLSRRDERTQPGVLTPGNPKKKVPPRRGGRRFLPNGRPINETANRYLPPLQGGWSSDRYPGLKPRAESFRPFGTKIKTGRRPSIFPTLQHSARQNSRTAGPTKPELYSADRSSRLRKRGALHNQNVGEVGSTITRRRTPNSKPRAPNACTP
jgi:hypothetical protein